MIGPNIPPRTAALIGVGALAVVSSVGLVTSFTELDHEPIILSGRVESIHSTQIKRGYIQDGYVTYAYVNIPTTSNHVHSSNPEMSVFVRLDEGTDQNIGSGDLINFTTKSYNPSVRGQTLYELVGPMLEGKLTSFRRRDEIFPVRLK